MSVAGSWRPTVTLAQRVRDTLHWYRSVDVPALWLLESTAGCSWEAAGAHA
jgi:hypothetical protein